MSGYLINISYTKPENIRLKLSEKRIIGGGEVGMGGIHSGRGDCGLSCCSQVRCKHWLEVKHNGGSNPKKEGGVVLIVGSID